MEKLITEAVIEIEPVDLKIGARSLLAPRNAVFVGVGDRNARYQAQLATGFPLWLGAAADLPGPAQPAISKAFYEWLLTAKEMPSTKIDAMIAINTLIALAKLCYTVENNGLYSVKGTFYLPRGVQLNVSKAVIDLVKQNKDVLLAIYTAYYGPFQEPESAPKLESPQTQEVPVEQETTQVE